MSRIDHDTGATNWPTWGWGLDKTLPPSCRLEVIVLPNGPLCPFNSNQLYFGNSRACIVCPSVHNCTPLFIDGGDIAFAKHTTVRENTDGRNLAEWARNRRSDDYELLCNDGTRKDIDDWMDCNMGQLPSNAVVTAGKLEQKYQELKTVAGIMCTIIYLFTVVM